MCAEWSIDYAERVCFGGVRSPPSADAVDEPGRKAPGQKAPGIEKHRVSKSTGPKSTGPESTGPKSTGPKSTGSKSTGSKSTGPKSTKSKSTGCRKAPGVEKHRVSKSTGPKSTGSKSTGPERIETDIGQTREPYCICFTLAQNTSAGPILIENLVYTKQQAESTLTV
jgi:hypothetical protein